MAGRYIIITECLTSIVLNSLQYCARQTVRGIVLRNSIAVASAIQILTKHMYMKVGSASYEVYLITLRRSDTFKIALMPL